PRLVLADLARRVSAGPNPNKIWQSQVSWPPLLASGLRNLRLPFFALKRRAGRYSVEIIDSNQRWLAMASDTAVSRQLIDVLYEARRDGTEPVLGQGAQLDQETALRVQLGVLDRFVGDGEQLGGWKAALSSGTSRDMMGKDFRPFGYVLKSRI